MPVLALTQWENVSDYDTARFAGENVAKGSGPGIHWAAHRLQGHRPYQEDCCVAEEVPGMTGHYFFAVFDGHGGGSCSAAAASSERGILRHFVDAVQPYCSDGPPAPTAIGAALRAAVLAFDWCEAQQYEKANLMLADGWDRMGWPNSSGSTAIIAVVTDTHCVVANVGDSRLALFRGPTIPPFTTVDHKPSHAGEKKRVKDAGGKVFLGRVNGVLSMTRALGDFEQKNPKKPQDAQVISPCPDISILERNPEDEALVLSSDGVWDVMTVEDVASVVRPRLPAVCDGEGADVCEIVLRASLASKSLDNNSIVLVAFEREYGDPNEEEAEDGQDASDDSSTIEIHQRLDAVNTKSSTLIAITFALRDKLDALRKRLQTIPC
eukprot:m.199250 g.199250  ORF g.199250 m.199250 type:complete len:380 (-) comp20692_c0_seq1:95-1234(-)